MNLRTTKLPSPLTRVVTISSLIGMLIGVCIAIYNHQEFGFGVFITVAVGVVFAVCSKVFISKWMYFWMETKLEVAAKEKEAALKLEMAKREEEVKKAEIEAAKLKAELSAGGQQTKPADSTSAKLG